MGIRVALVSMSVVFKTLQVDEVTLEKMQVEKRGQRVRPGCSVFTEKSWEGEGGSESLGVGRERGDSMRVGRPCGARSGR